MAGGGGGVNLPNHPFPLHNRTTSPPFPAIDRFLVNVQSQSGDVTKKMEIGFGGFSPCDGGGDENGDVLPCLHDYVDAINNHDLHLNHEVISSSNNNDDNNECNNRSKAQFEEGSSCVRKSLKRGRNHSYAALVKRKWLEEEDRALVKLVKHYGMKKWAGIAQKLDGRTAKQCRERWQNHLRPDIKKDSWNEEEERIFIEAHKKLGNRWSEIARKIPGRTENAVKNHWNAAKRRKLERKSKKKEGVEIPNPPSLLQDYIKSNNLYDTNCNSLTKTSHIHNNISPKKAVPGTQGMNPQQKKGPQNHQTTSTDIANHPSFSIFGLPRVTGTIDYLGMPLMEPFDDCNYSSPLIGEAYTEDLLFMVDNFNTQHLQQPPPPLLQNLSNGNNNLYDYHDHDYDYQLLTSNLLGGATNHNFSSSLSSAILPKVECSTDYYFDDSRNFGSTTMEMEYFTAMDGGDQLRKDMDLIEMVSSTSILHEQTTLARA